MEDDYYSDEDGNDDVNYDDDEENSQDEENEEEEEEEEEEDDEEEEEDEEDGEEEEEEDEEEEEEDDGSPLFNPGNPHLPYTASPTNTVPISFGAIGVVPGGTVSPKPGNILPIPIFNRSSPSTPVAAVSTPQPTNVGPQSPLKFGLLPVSTTSSQPINLGSPQSVAIGGTSLGSFPAQQVEKTGLGSFPAQQIEKTGSGVSINLGQSTTTFGPFNPPTVNTGTVQPVSTGQSIPLQLKLGSASTPPKPLPIATTHFQMNTASAKPAVIPASPTNFGLPIATTATSTTPTAKPVQVIPAFSGVGQSTPVMPSGSVRSPTRIGGIIPSPNAAAIKPFAPIPAATMSSGSPIVPIGSSSAKPIQLNLTPQPTGQVSKPLTFPLTPSSTGTPIMTNQPNTGSPQSFGVVKPVTGLQFGSIPSSPITPQSTGTAVALNLSGFKPATVGNAGTIHTGSQMPNLAGLSLTPPVGVRKVEPVDWNVVMPRTNTEQEEWYQRALALAKKGYEKGYSVNDSIRLARAMIADEQYNSGPTGKERIDLDTFIKIVS